MPDLHDAFVAEWLPATSPSPHYIAHPKGKGYGRPEVTLKFLKTRMRF
jgi:hypothetical protein